MSIDQTQVLQKKLYSKKTKQRTWLCCYGNCFYVLTDAKVDIRTKFCPLHKEEATYDKNHKAYVRKIGGVGRIKHINKREAFLYLLKSKRTSSKYELLAYSTIKNMDSFRATVTTLRSMGYKIYRKKTFYRLGVNDEI